MAARSIVASIHLVSDVLHAVDAIPLTANQIHVAAGIVIAAGLALLILGLKLSRVTVALGGAALGFMVAPWVAHRLGTYGDGGTSFRVTQGVMAFCMSILALVDARLLWALGAGFASVAAAAAAMVATPIQITANAPPAESWAGNVFLQLAPWSQDAWLYVHSFATAFLGQYGTMMGLFIPACGVAVFVLALIFARPAQIAMTSLLGSAAMMAGGLLLVGQHHRGLWDQARGNSLAVLGIVVGLALVGMVVQRLLFRPREKKAKPRPVVLRVPQPPTGPRTH